VSVERGAGRRGEPTPSEAKRPEKNQPTLEVGEGRGGVPPPQGEQAKPKQEGREREPLPSVWDVVERHWRFFTRELPPMTEGERLDYRSETWRLETEIKEKGTPRDKHILDLFMWGVILKPDPEGRSSYERLVPEDFQQFRSLVEKSSEEELAEELHKHEPKKYEPPHPATGTFYTRRR
jgi:hypothetical protein